jgi:hypothetical protein
MRPLLLIPFLFLGACADSADAPNAAGGTASAADASSESTADEQADGADAELSDEEQTQRADEAIAAFLEAEPDLVFVGDWDCGDGGTSFESISFGKDSDQGDYRAFLHDRPAGNGTWSYADGTLSLNGTDGTSTFTDAAVQGSTMTLTNSGTTFSCTLVPISP